MPPGLRPVETPATHPNASRAYAVIEASHNIGTVLLVLRQQPTGASLRRDWWAIPPATDTRPLPRPFDTRSAAVQTLRYRAATLNRPAPTEPADATLGTIRAAYSHAGPTAAVWLANALTVHHLAELDAHRDSSAPALWRELRRIIAWLQAATGDEPDPMSAGSVSIGVRVFFRADADLPARRALYGRDRMKIHQSRPPLVDLPARTAL